MGDGHIGGIGNLHLVLLDETALLHIHVIYFDSVLVSLGVRGDICHILLFFHAKTSVSQYMALLYHNHFVF